MRRDRFAHVLIVLVRRKGHLEKKIDKITIHGESPWVRKHWESPRENYAKSPYFRKYADFFEDIYSRRRETLGNTIAGAI